MIEVFFSIIQRAVSTWNLLLQQWLSHDYISIGYYRFFSLPIFLWHFDPTMAPSPPVARTPPTPPSSLMYLSLCLCSAVAPASDHLLNETRMSGPHIFASYHRSPTVPDCGSFKSPLLIPLAGVGSRVSYMKGLKSGSWNMLQILHYRDFTEKQFEKS